MLSAVLAWEHVTLQKGLMAWQAGLCRATSIPPWLVFMAHLVALQPSSTYLMIWIVVDCASFLVILWAFVLLK